MSRRITSPIWMNSRCREADLSARQGAGELAYRFLVLLVSDFGKVAGDFQQHALMRRDLPRPFLADAFVKIGDRCAQRAGDLEQSSGGDAPRGRESGRPGISKQVTSATTLQPLCFGVED